MALTTRKNETVKSLQTVMAHFKKVDENIRYEWEMACNTSHERGNVYSQKYIHEHYSRKVDWCDNEAGATKVCHLKNEFGNKFEYIVIKRAKSNASKNLGNQLIEEINCWNELAETKDADLLCPVLKYFTSKSDKVSKNSDKMFNNVVIIAQKAVHVDDAKGACRKAEELNKERGLHGETAKERYEKLEALSNKKHWWDAMQNSGNSGVIFDYAKGYYKAVFIDYAL